MYFYKSGVLVFVEKLFLSVRLQVRSDGVVTTRPLYLDWAILQEIAFRMFIFAHTNPQHLYLYDMNRVASQSVG